MEDQSPAEKSELPADSQQREMLAALLKTITSHSKQIQGSASGIESLIQELFDLSHDKLKLAEAKYDELKTKAENALLIAQNNLRIAESENKTLKSSLQDACSQNHILREEIVKLKSIIETTQNESASKASSYYDKITNLEKNLQNVIAAKQRLDQENSEQIDLLKNAIEADTAQKIQVFELKLQQQLQERSHLKLEMEKFRHETATAAQEQQQLLEDEKAITARQAKIIERYEQELTKLKELKQDLQARLAIAEENRSLAPSSSIQSPTQEIEALSLLQKELENQRQIAQKIKKEVNASVASDSSSSDATIATPF